MPDNRCKIAVFILAKNEEQNLERCLQSLSHSNWPVYVFDSGSTDRTIEIASKYSFTKIVNHQYKNHCDSYNEILQNSFGHFDFVAILDSDMQLSPQMIDEIKYLTHSSLKSWEALVADVEMRVEGVTLNRASLYPPKPFLFRVGATRFVGTGHSETLMNGTKVKRTSAKLVHDDRKIYSSYLQSQFRYSQNLLDRYNRGNVSGRDVIRIRWPFLIFLVPLFSLIFKGGFLDGRAGIVYALDRLIAEAIMYRQALASRLRKDSQ